MDVLDILNNDQNRALSHMNRKNITVDVFTKKFSATYAFGKRLMG